MVTHSNWLFPVFPQGQVRFSVVIGYKKKRGSFCPLGIWRLNKEPRKTYTHKGVIMKKKRRKTISINGISIISFNSPPFQARLSSLFTEDKRGDSGCPCTHGKEVAEPALDPDHSDCCGYSQYVKIQMMTEFWEGQEVPGSSKLCLLYIGLKRRLRTSKLQWVGMASPLRWTPLTIKSMYTRTNFKYVVDSFLFQSWWTLYFKHYRKTMYLFKVVNIVARVPVINAWSRKVVGIQGTLSISLPNPLQHSAHPILETECSNDTPG